MDELDNKKDEEDVPEPDEEPVWKGPIKYIVAIFLIFLMVIWIVPSFTIKMDPNPTNIPKIKDVVPQDLNLSKQRINLSTIAALRKAVDPEDPVIKQASTKIAAQSCTGNQVCQAKAIYYFTRDNIEYVADPIDFDYVEPAREVLATHGGDCESGTLLMASMMESIGVNAEIVIIPEHAFLRIYLPDAKNKYKQKDGWIYLDWTCKDCEFGQVPNENLQKQMEYVDVY